MAWPGASFIPVAHDPILTMIAQPWQQQFISPQNAAAFQAASLTANQSYRMPHSLPVVNGNGTNGISQIQSGHGQTNKQYDSQKQFGSLPQTSKRNKISVTSKTNLYISGLSESDNDETVRELVKGVVDPKSCKAMMSDGKCKGSGFIDCATEEDAERAMQHILEVASRTHKKLTVKYANENEKDNHNVYVRNLPKINFNNEDLQNLFGQYGTVTSVKLLESNGVYTGTGFVRFSSPEQALAAVEAMNQEKKVFPDCDRPINCKLADKTDSRRRVRASPQSNGGDQSISNGISAVTSASMAHTLNMNSVHPQSVSLLTAQTVNSVMGANGYLPGGAGPPPANQSSNAQRRQSSTNHTQNQNQLQNSCNMAQFHSPQQQQQLISNMHNLNLTGSNNHSSYTHQAAATHHPAAAAAAAAATAAFQAAGQQAGSAPTPNQTSNSAAYFHPVQFASGVPGPHQNAQHAGYNGVPGPGGLLYASQPGHPAAAYQLLPYAHGHPFNLQYYSPTPHPSSAQQQFSA